VSAPRRYKVVVYVPASHAETVREALAGAGAGRIGAYSQVSFTVRGVGRFRPGEGARPAIGAVGQLEEVGEDRIETVCDADVLEPVVAAVRAAHPYEEVVIDAYPLADV
jgi:hypothetical protein